MIENHESIDVFIGLDVGKGDHHTVALDRTGKKLLDQALPNDEARLPVILQELESQGRSLLVVDQPATIGAPSTTKLTCRLTGTIERPGLTGTHSLRVTSRGRV